MCYLFSFGLMFVAQKDLQQISFNKNNSFYV